MLAGQSTCSHTSSSVLLGGCIGMVYCQYLNIKDTFPPHSCSAIMDVKVVFVIVCLCALAISSTEAGIPKCCMSTKNHVKEQILNYVQRWEMQEIRGACEIRALVLHVKGFKRPVCAHPRVMAVMEKLKRKKKRRSS